MTPQQKYQQDLQRPGFVADPAQAMAVTRLEQGRLAAIEVRER